MSIKNDISATLACPLGEHYSPAAAQQGAVLGVPFHGAGEHYAFEVTADGGSFSASAVWPARSTPCSMIGPSSRSPVTSGR